MYFVVMHYHVYNTYMSMHTFPPFSLPTTVGDHLFGETTLCWISRWYLERETTVQFVQRVNIGKIIPTSSYD